MFFRPVASAVVVVTFSISLVQAQVTLDVSKITCARTGDIEKATRAIAAATGRINMAHPGCWSVEAEAPNEKIARDAIRL